MARRRSIVPIRSRRSFERSAGRRAPRSIILIVCEGESELVYFDAVREKYELSTAEVILVENTVGSAPKSVVQCAVRRCAEPGGYDRVFCIFDRDQHATFADARQRIRDLARRPRNPLPIEEAISIPCFEFWVLLHFVKTAQPFANCGQVVDRLRNDHLPGYVKADAKVAGELVKHLDRAVSNANWLEQLDAVGDNPSTSLHRVIQHLRDMAEK